MAANPFPLAPPSPRGALRRKPRPLHPPDAPRGRGFFYPQKGSYAAWKIAGAHMYGPAYHRQQAELLTRVATTVSNVDAAAALLALAAKHRALADEGERERAAQQRKQILSKEDRPSPQSR